MMCCWIREKNKGGGGGTNTTHKTLKPRSHEESRSHFLCDKHHQLYQQAALWAGESKKHVFLPPPPLRRCLHLITYVSLLSNLSPSHQPRPHSLVASSPRCLRDHGRGSCSEARREHGNTAVTPAAHGGSPSLKPPTLRVLSGEVWGTELIWRGPRAPTFEGRCCRACRWGGAQEAPATLARFPAGRRSASPQPPNPSGQTRGQAPSPRGRHTRSRPSPPRGGPTASPALRPFPYPRRPSWRRLTTAQPRFENSPPRFPRPLTAAGSPPLATTPQAQNAP